MKFSQRIGKSPASSEIQRESMDEALRAQLWNVFRVFFADEIMKEANRTISGRVSELPKSNRFFLRLWHQFFKPPTDTIPIYADRAIEKIRDWYMSAQWYEVYDFVEFVAHDPRTDAMGEFGGTCNSVLEKQNSAYRFIAGQLAPVTDEVQIDGVNHAIESTAKLGLTVC
jgi:AbiJ N-terminal domain 4